MHAESVTFWLQIVQPFTGFREPKWTSGVKRPSDVAQL